MSTEHHYRKIHEVEGIEAANELLAKGNKYMGPACRLLANWKEDGSHRFLIIENISPDCGECQEPPASQEGRETSPTCPPDPTSSPEASPSPAPATD